MDEDIGNHRGSRLDVDQIVRSRKKARKDLREMIQGEDKPPATFGSVNSSNNNSDDSGEEDIRCDCAGDDTDNDSRNTTEGFCKSSIKKTTSQRTSFQLASGKEKRKGGCDSVDSCHRTEADQQTNDQNLSTKEARYAAKREYNRLNAARARVRQKDRLWTLERDYAQLSELADRLQRENDILKSQVDVLLKKKQASGVSSSVSSSSSPSSRPPSKSEQQQEHSFASPNQVNNGNQLIHNTLISSKEPISSLVGKNLQLASSLPKIDIPDVPISVANATTPQGDINPGNDLFKSILCNATSLLLQQQQQQHQHESQHAKSTWDQILALSQYTPQQQHVSQSLPSVLAANQCLHQHAANINLMRFMQHGFLPPSSQPMTVTPNLPFLVANQYQTNK